MFVPNYIYNPTLRTRIIGISGSEYKSYYEMDNEPEIIFLRGITYFISKRD